MRFTAIETASWEALKRHIQALTQTMRTLFGEPPPIPTFCTMAMYAKSWASAREPCSTIGIRVLCRSFRLGISAITSVQTSKHCLRSPTANKPADGTRSNQSDQPRNAGANRRLGRGPKTNAGGGSIPPTTIRWRSLPYRA